MKRSDFRFLHRLRVRRAEVDARRIVFNGHYLNYLDAAIADYWRTLGLPGPQAFGPGGGELCVKKATLDYHAPARGEDLLEVGLKCLRAGTSSMVFAAAIFRLDELLLTGELVYVHVDAAQAAIPLPQELGELVEAFESGQPMVQVRVGGWDELAPDARAIRTEVFLVEQRIPAELEWDEADAECVHAVAYGRHGQALATGRLLEHVPGVAKIGRMAVKRGMRGSGVGRAVLEALMKAAKARGDREAVLHAQLSAAPFYARLGFRARGPEFEEAGIAHVEMVKTL